jgi:hypothetical protein
LPLAVLALLLPLEPKCTEASRDARLLGRRPFRLLDVERVTEDLLNCDGWAAPDIGPNHFVPRIAGVARLLLALSLAHQIGIGEPLSPARTVEVDSLRPELIAVPSQGVQIGSLDPHRPEASAAGLVTKITVGVRRSRKHTLARNLKDSSAVGWPVAIRRT